MKVYVATEGSYSDYHILGVFTNEADAASVGEVEEYEVYEKVPARVTSHAITGFPPDFEPRSDVHVLFPWDYGWESYGTKRRPKVQRFPNGGLRVSGTSRSIVEKAYQDRVGQLKAEAAGVA